MLYLAVGTGAGRGQEQAENREAVHEQGLSGFNWTDIKYERLKGNFKSKLISSVFYD